MLCSRRGMHPMDCRIACDLSVVRHHRIYRKLSSDMLGACVSAMMVSDCPHGQETRIPQRKLPPEMPPHGAFQPNPHRRGHRQGQEIKSAFSFDYDHEASQPRAPIAARAAQRPRGRGVRTTAGGRMQPGVGPARAGPTGWLRTLRSLKRLGQSWSVLVSCRSTFYARFAFQRLVTLIGFS